jgi:hypothetical protein
MKNESLTLQETDILYKKTRSSDVNFMFYCLLLFLYFVMVSDPNKNYYYFFFILLLFLCRMKSVFQRRTLKVRAQKCMVVRSGGTM